MEWVPLPYPECKAFPGVSLTGDVAEETGCRLLRPAV